MTNHLKLIISGALCGFFSAALTDINAWAKSDSQFDWKLAIKRWIAGALTGLAGSAGFAGLNP